MYHGRKRHVCHVGSGLCKKDGKYYYYFPAKAKNDKAFRRIGVGVSDNPMGPFKWEKIILRVYRELTRDFCRR